MMAPPTLPKLHTARLHQQVPLSLSEVTARPKEVLLVMEPENNHSGDDPYLSLGGPVQILEEGLLLSSRTYAESAYALRAHNVGLVINVAIEVVNGLLEMRQQQQSSPPPVWQPLGSPIPKPQRCDSEESGRSMRSSFSCGDSCCCDETPSMSPTLSAFSSPMMETLQQSIDTSFSTTSNKNATTPNKPPAYIKIEWDHGSDISVELPQLLQVIDDFLERREGNEQVLVACNQGVSRSASLVIACVMRRRGLGLMEAYDYVKGKNEFISPNVGLLGQLALFQEQQHLLG